MGAKSPLDLCNLLISGGFQAQRVLSPPGKKKNVSPPGKIPEYAPDKSALLLRTSLGFI